MGYVEEIRSMIGHRPLILVGAVVLIIDEKNRILMQKRTYPNGMWGLPGGLMELTESSEETARREVLEETGLTVGRLNLLHVSSGRENYCIAENGDEFYVVTIAYTTDEFSGEITADETESMECKFFSFEELPEYIAKSHRLLIDRFYCRK